MSAEFLPEDPWMFRVGTFAVRASCPHCGKDLQLGTTSPPTGVCECGYRVELCGDHLRGMAGGKTCVREKDHRGWHLSPSATGWGRAIDGCGCTWPNGKRWISQDGKSADAQQWCPHALGGGQ